MFLGLLDDAEMGQREPLRRAALDLVHRPLPGLEVDIRRRGHRQDVAVRHEAHAGGIAGIERSVAVQVADMVRRVTR